MPDAAPLSPATIVVSAGRPARTQAGPVNPPIVLSSTYVSQGAVPDGELFYARADTETWHPFEETLGALEGSAHPAVLFGSGMAAIAAALSLLPPGGRVVVPRHAYNVTVAHAHDLAARTGAQVTVVDVADTEAVVAAVRGDGPDGDGSPAAMLWVESPTNPMLEVADVPALVEAAHAVGALVAVDNTFATPLGQQPLALGADVVVHSLTKYMGGHSDVVGGALITGDPELGEELAYHQNAMGAVAGPFDSWLVLRSLKTLGVRMDRHSANAARVVEFLLDSPKVASVLYPGLPSHPGHDIAAKQMSGFGGMVSFRLRDGEDAALKVCERAQVFTLAESLGGVESLIEHPGRMTHASAAGSPLEVPADLVRLSVGIEDVDDLLDDLEPALG